MGLGQLEQSEEGERSGGIYSAVTWEGVKGLWRSAVRVGQERGGHPSALGDAI